MPNVISASPALIRTALTPSEPTTISFELTNSSDQPLPVTLRAYNVGNTSRDSIPWNYDATISSQHELAQWLTVDAPTVTLAPNTPTHIQATIKTDESMAAGGHYGSIVVALANANNGAATVVGVQGRLSILVFATKQGGTESLKPVTTSYQRTLWGWPKTVAITFRNDGSTDLIPHGRVQITTAKTSEVSSVLNQQSQTIFPDNTHTYYTSIPEPARYLPGKYRVHASYQAGTTVQGEITDFVVIIPPWFFVLCTIFLLLILRTVIHKRRGR